MRRMRFCSLLFLIVWGASSAYAQQVFTQEDLNQMGITRLGDLFQYTDGWAASSTDFYHWDATALGLAPEHAPTWMLFVDGKRVDLRALGRASLTMLPVPVTEISQVKFFTRPVQIGGVVAPAGAVHVHTSRPGTGLVARGAIEAGSETGDPGPHRFLREGDRNVDRTGPAAHAAVMIGSGRSHLRASGQLDEHHATHPLIRPRVRTLFRGEKDARIHLRSIAADLALDRAWGTLSGWAASSTMEDLRFFDRMGLEVPANHNVTLAHLTVGLANAPIGFGLSAQRTRLSTRSNPLDVDVAFHLTDLRGQLHWGVSTTTRVGLYANLVRTWGFGMDAYQTRALPGAFVASTFALQPTTHLTTNVSLDYADGTAGMQALGTLRSRAVTATVLWSQRPPAEIQGYNYWSSLGYQPRGPGEEQLVELPPRIRTQAADLSWQITDAPVRLVVRGGIRRYSNYPMARYVHQYDSLTTGLLPTTTVVTTSGLAANAGASLEVFTAGPFATSLAGRYIYPVSEEHAFRAAWRTRSRVVLRLRYQPNLRFSLFGALQYRSNSEWADYTLAASHAPDRYAAALPGAWVADLTIQKRFWQQRLRLTAKLRNILDRPYRTHPGGASSRLAFHLRIQFAMRAFTSR